MSQPRRGSRMRRWLLAAAVAGVIALLGEMMLPPVRGGTGRSLWFGVASAALVVVCALLGVRKRWLRLRLGSLASWTAAHHALGLLALALALAHAQWQYGGLLTTALLALLVLTTLSGIVGAILQQVIPAMMTSRLPSESKTVDFEPQFVGLWRQAHELVVSACGPQKQASRRLRAAEQAAGISADKQPESVAAPKSAAEEQPRASSREALATFYSAQVVDFLSAPSDASALASPSGAALAFAALRASVDREMSACIDELEGLCTRARFVAQERKLHRVLFGWQLLHVPLAVLTLILLVAHGVAAVYY